ncbi:hypothetical protein CCAX7_56920 [Capsulimonas corticalis]|uniref:Uncharacterized protein n=1 Tax=Capsulimonas corticalis TaxID=2219043 RepID=A0A402D0J4_9BACT|nr:hypothetical protein [Capsulimonas corticalis]BDI33641.1 hypothetical protein CCAX7_56920 [Capsulimonas corticalis]
MTTITLDLTTAELALLHRRADADGVTIIAVLHTLIAQLAPQAPAEPPRDFGAALSALRGEPMSDDPEEIAERERENTEMQNNIARWRAEQDLEK